MDTQEPNPEPEIQIEYAPDAEVVPKPESQPIAEPDTLDEDKDYLKLDRKSLAQEINRLEREDPEFANVYNSNVGSKAKRKYQPQIDELNSRIESLNREIRRREILAMEDKEIDDKFASDPTFAKEYAEAVHRDPEVERARIEQRWQIQEFNEIMASALDYGLSEDKAKEFLQSVGSGKYDRDEDNNPVPWTQGLMKLQREINDTILNQKLSVKPPPEPQANLEITKPGPDTSSVGVRGTRRDTSIEDYQKALREGKDFSSEEVDRITAKYANR